MQCFIKLRAPTITPLYCVFNTETLLSNFLYSFPLIEHLTSSSCNQSKLKKADLVSQPKIFVLNIILIHSWIAVLL